MKPRTLAIFSRTVWPRIRRGLLIPVEHARRLKAGARNSPHKLWILKGLGHTGAVRIGK